MRYEKGHKESTRRRIIETAAARFRKDGIEAVGLADLMAEAGLTHGGFYSHFSSKEDLVRAAMDEAAGQSQERFTRRIEEGGLETWIRSYLRTGHRDHPEGGCAMAALASELARHPKETRKGFAKRLERVTANVEEHLPASMTPDQRQQAAVGIFATLVGAMQMARVIDDPVRSEQILEAGIASALTLAHLTPKPS